MINKLEIEKLAKQLMLKLTDEEISEIILDFEIFNQHLNLLNRVDTTTIEPLVYGRTQVLSSMREDDWVDNMSTTEVFENAPSRVDDFFKVTAVVE